MGIGNILKSSIIPIALIVIILDIGTVINAIPGVNLVMLCAGPIGWLLSGILVAWAGYSAVKGGSGVMGAATTGVVVGFVSQLLAQILNMIITAIMVAVGITVTASSQGDLTSLLTQSVGGILALVFMPVIAAIFGAIAGAIGGAVAGSPKK